MNNIRLLFNSLIQDGEKLRRKTTLLRHPDAEPDNRWYMSVPKCFNAALDIRYTERKENKKSYWIWTQGADFSFSQGDILYDCSNAYEDDWSKAIQKIRRCIQIKFAIPAKGAEEGSRFQGKIVADLFEPDDKREKLKKVGFFEMTQYEFVECLIFGPQFKNIQPYT